MTKAIFFDVDGTLVSFQTHQVSPAVVDALHQLRAQGIKLFLATGRHPAMIGNVRSLFPFDGYMTLSGQLCTVGDQVVHSSPMEPQAVEELVSAARDGAFSCLFLEEKDIYLNLVNDLTRRFMGDLNLDMPPVRDPREALGKPLYQAVTFLTRENEHLLLSRAPHVKTTRWHPEFLDVIPTSGGKDQGMEAILNFLGIPLEQSMAFGDGENDLSMLRHAGIGVAMGTASQEVRQGADYVTGTVDEDGIVTALKHFGLL
ncbi:Cof-type HAD-IIB family hydrolase [Pseudoflavonifractor sp. AF19-9AC]|uniref:Cof-type HAD-IIB family hydrolase n=1 Tax=Pseudoflavonifractor sp. AF19-9AC TaxID=2292244 RepID=UPI00131486AF|nr:Cof-type HAD-IIB family hydrolase [Pseudoflavonifractor sp. AF19-9AC]